MQPQNNHTKSDEIADPLMEKLNKEKNIALKAQERRFIDVNDNYQLYRNKVITNRLTQRQAVNIPLMKETIKTLLSKIDDPANNKFKELGGDRQKEIMLQARYDEDMERLNFEGVDIQDKKTVLLNGRGFIKLNYVDGDFEIDALDWFDVSIDPYVNPLNIETARFLCHQNIFRSIEQILENKKFSVKGRKALETYIDSEEGMVQSEKTKEALDKKQERLETLGMAESDIKRFTAGQVIVNLTEHYTMLWDKTLGRFVRYVVIYANDTIRLFKTPLKQTLGVDFLPFTTWGEDVETQDFWSDGPADLVRVPNKILNIFLSQMIENRTLKNFQMHWYDASIKNFQPQTYEPGAGKMLPAPGNPREVIMPVDISGLEDCLTQIDFLIKLVERGTSATAIEKGVSEKKQITLGEVEMLVGKAMEQTLSMAKFYRRARKEIAMKYWQIVQANDKKTRTLYKTSGKGNVWPKKIKPNDWISKEGYRVESKSSSEQEAEETKSIQRMMAIKNQFPNNVALQRILQGRMLELVDLTPEELKEVETEEERMQEARERLPEPEVPGGEDKIRQEIEGGVKDLETISAGV